MLNSILSRRSHFLNLDLQALAFLAAVSVSGFTLPSAQAQTDAKASSAQIKEAVRTDAPRLLKSLETLVSIESGSRDLEGLATVAKLISERLQVAGMTVETIPLKAPQNHILLKGAEVGSAVYGRLKGTGQKKVLLIAHMDTVYPKGMLAKQPFRIEGNRAYGLAVSDDKGGVALVLHTVELLQKMGYTNYAELAVLINGDEEIGSPGSGPLLTKLGGEYDAVFSYEGGGSTEDWVRLATSSIAIATLNITGKASHAGAAPEAGRNALYEMAHQILKSKDFGNKSKGLSINWTVAKSGETRNVIPAQANAIADIRAQANADLDQIEAALQNSVKEKLIPDTKVELEFLRSRPAFVANDASRVLAKHAVTVFGEINKPLVIRDTPTGGGTDAAFAGLKPKGGVLESFGLRGHGGHSNDDEYIFIDSIEPRLYLSTRMVMDVGSGAVRW
jgi:glutamate carboxypeptidase